MNLLALLCLSSVQTAVQAYEDAIPQELCQDTDDTRLSPSLLQNGLRVAAMESGSRHLQGPELVAEPPDAIHTGQEHFWTRRAANPASSSSSPYSAPSDFSSGPTWTWKNEYDERLGQSPLIDSDMNIYIYSASKIRKFTSDGHPLWTWSIPSLFEKFGGSPALAGPTLYVNTLGPLKTSTLFAIDIVNASIQWWKTLSLKSCVCQAQGMLVYDNKIFVALQTDMSTIGDHVVQAVDASNGNELWAYDIGDAVWNFNPSTPGDGTLIMASNCGVVTRLTLDGKRVWQRAGELGLRPGRMCSSGGGAMGPNGIFYAVYNDGNETYQGAYVDARNISDGSIVWKKRFGAGDGGHQYPAVGKLSNGRLAVLANVGMMTGAPPPETEMLYKLTGESRLSSELPLEKSFKNAVVALDAATGEQIWRFDEEPWRHLEPIGDHLKWERLAHNYGDLPLCDPDTQGIPLIAGDGTVYISSSHNGELYAIKDSNRTGNIQLSEVSVFKTNRCFLNSPSLAPGMLVVAPCSGDVYVFKQP